MDYVLFPAMHGIGNGDSWDFPPNRSPDSRQFFVPRWIDIANCSFQKYVEKCKMEFLVVVI